MRRLRIALAVRLAAQRRKKACTIGVAKISLGFQSVLPIGAPLNERRTLRGRRFFLIGCGCGKSASAAGKRCERLDHWSWRKMSFFDRGGVSEIQATIVIACDDCFRWHALSGFQQIADLGLQLIGQSKSDRAYGPVGALRTPGDVIARVAITREFPLRIVLLWCGWIELVECLEESALA